MTGRRADSADVHVDVDGIRYSVRDVGSGDPILLLHGFPHTRQVWREVEPHLVAAGHRVLAPDLRGLGDTDLAESGFDALNQAADLVRLLDALAVPAAHIVGFDIGAAPAFAMATAHSGHVGSLTVIEAIIGGLPGAEAFLSGGGPWWFAFHRAPGGLAEDVVSGSENRYVRYFLEVGCRSHFPADLAASFVEAYSGRDRLRAAFEHYRAMPSNAVWNQSWTGHNRLSMPVTAVGASTVGNALADQLRLICDDLAEHELADAGHIVPVDAPRELAAIVLATARRKPPGSEVLR